MKLVWPFVLLALALTACSELRPYANSGYAPVVSREYGTDYWLAELYNTRGMTPEELQQAVSVWEQEFHDDPNIGTRIKLALLLTVGDEPARDRKRARELLEGLEETPLETSDRELVAILQQILDDQEQAEMAISLLKNQAREQSERIKELEEQQQALTDIEQNIQQRDIQPGIEQNFQQPGTPPDIEQDSRQQDTPPDMEHGDQ